MTTPNTPSEPRLLNLLADPQERTAERWEDHLNALIPNEWATGAFDPDQLLLVTGKRASVAHGAVCGRGHCPRLATTDHDLCQSCADDCETSDLTLEAFRLTSTGCLVPVCPEPHYGHELCVGHHARWKGGRPGDIAGWAATQTPLREALRRSGCFVPDCRNDHHGRGLCYGHWQRWAKGGRPYDPAEWAAKQPIVAKGNWVRHLGCLVIDCPHDHKGRGLCDRHYGRWERAGEPEDAAGWAAQQQSLCLVPGCDNDRASEMGVCGSHEGFAVTWAERTGRGDAQRFDMVSLWLENADLDSVVGSSVLGFGVLPAPLSLELAAVAATYQNPVKRLWRSLIKGCLDEGVTTAVGATELPATSKEGQRLGASVASQVNKLHRNWVEAPLPGDNIFLAELNYTGDKRLGRNAHVNLDGIGSEALKEALRDWILTTRHISKCEDVYGAVAVAGIMTHVLAGVNPMAWSRQHITRVVQIIRTTWKAHKAQESHLKDLDRVLEHARYRAADEPHGDDPDWVDAWRDIPATFVRNHRLLESHRAAGKRGKSKREDEDYRYVPAPVMNHLMDNLPLLHWSARAWVVQRYGERVLNAENRLLLYVSYALGLRPIETVNLHADGLKTTTDGDVMLEWRRKKTRAQVEERVRRRPANPELIDAIQDWLDLRSQAGVTSQWLFPNLNDANTDKHLPSTHVIDAIKKLIKVVPELPAPVETAKGTRVRFDLATVDAYCFRHAFAQRCADAYILDRDGNRVDRIPPVILQHWMDHKSHDTTQHYYNVSRERQQRALLSLPPLRSFNIYGETQREQVSKPDEWAYRRAPQGAFCANPSFLAGHRCPSDENCELCPEWRILPTDRHYVLARQRDLRIKLQNSKALKSPPARIAAFEAGIKHCQIVLDALDRYIARLDPKLQQELKESLAAQEQLVDEYRLRPVNIKQWAEQEEGV